MQIKMNEIYKKEVFVSKLYFFIDQGLYQWSYT